MEFVAILLGIWGILEIILFFKVWGATNNIDQIKSKYVDHDESDSINNLRKLYLQGFENEAHNILNISLGNSVSGLFYEVKNRYGTKDGETEYETCDSIVGDEKGNKMTRDEYFVQKIQTIIKEYAPKYKSIGKEIPKTFTTVTYKSLYYFGKEIG